MGDKYSFMKQQQQNQMNKQKTKEENQRAGSGKVFQVPDSCPNTFIQSI